MTTQTSINYCIALSLSSIQVPQSSANHSVCANAKDGLLSHLKRYTETQVSEMPQDNFLFYQSKKKHRPVNQPRVILRFVHYELFQRPV